MFRCLSQPFVPPGDAGEYTFYRGQTSRGNARNRVVDTALALAISALLDY